MLTIKYLAKGKTKGGVKVTKVVFTIAGKPVKTRRSAPFGARLTARQSTCVDALMR
jgi:hypothetical protein